MTIYCEKCEKGIKPSGPAHKCTFCKKYFHITKCSNSIVVDENFEEKDNITTVLCAKCIIHKLGQITPLVNNSNALHEEVNVLKGDVTQLNEKANSQKEEIRSMSQRFDTSVSQISLLTQQVATASETLQQLAERFENSYSSSAQAIQPQADELMKSVAEHMVELQEREKRKLNILIRGVPEVLASAPESDDKTKVRYYLFQRAMGIPETQIPESAMVSIRRVGRPSQDYPRHLIVTLDSMKTKVMILRAAPNLRRKSLDNVNVRDNSNGIYISPDYTKQQQQQQKDLRDEVKRRRASGEQVRIFRNQVVPVINPAPGPASQNSMTQRSQPQQGHPINAANHPSTSVGQTPPSPPIDSESYSSN